MKKTTAFYDKLLYAIICGPMMIAAIVLWFVIYFKGTIDWKSNKWYIILIFAIVFMIPMGGKMMFRYYYIENGYICFYYFPFTRDRKQLYENIDVKWNQKVLLSEIKNVKLVKLTEEEKQTKVYFKHWFNKYLKIELENEHNEYGDTKYIYVGNYSNSQILEIIRRLTSKQKY
ncbi:MAG: hypothetical protein MRZ09_08570 [Coprobacillus sp.]|nr:hypothetical protein [Coprobacillus sp.]